MKIKQKKQLNLPQLIEWAQDNIEEATKKVYRVNENEILGDHVRFTEVYSDLEVRLHGYIPFDTTFTVEAEEEITEDTEFKRLVCIDDNDKTVAFSNFTIRELKDIGVKEFHAYIDGEFKLIWRDGKLVE